MNVPDYYILHQQCEPVVIDNNTMPYMKSLYSCLNRVKGDGYTEDFEKVTHGIQAVNSTHIYLPEDYKIINFIRFEGNDKSGDNVIMYMIETNDGVKGTLVKSYDSPTEKKIVISYSNTGDNRSFTHL